LVSLPVLSLPPIQPQLHEKEGVMYIYDFLRKKHLLLTPEEWVRQHWIHFLIAKGFPKGWFVLEKGLRYNGLQKRTDLLIYDREGKPYLLVECKAPEIEIDQKVVSQAFVYNQTLKCPYVTLSNGRKHVFFHRDIRLGEYIQKDSLPKIP